MAITGSAWNLSNPKKPTAEMDKDDILDWPWDWSLWVDESGTLLATHSMTLQAPLQEVTSSIVTGSKTVVARIGVDHGTYDPAQHLNKVFSAICHVVAVDGQERDWTLWFKIVER